MPIRFYQDLQVWKEARVLASHVYRVTSRFPTHERYGLALQLRRAVVSIPSNIAEGNGSGFRATYARHVATAHGSLMELETQLLIASDLEYLGHGELASLMQGAERIGVMLRSLLAALRQPI